MTKDSPEDNAGYVLIPGYRVFIMLGPSISVSWPGSFRREPRSSDDVTNTRGSLTYAARLSQGLLSPLVPDSGGNSGLVARATTEYESIRAVTRSDE
ncbi:hypothetical protein K0M31_007758 [Melipona bicolor]|uniref:Uncharacterized protein n=1 Tax=Melipona bicolor TaxID=60889 RepID=A0AA40GC00_9HYME|nr:hypothetical protein K0M31_007758 [Melipona bicolor]